MAKSKAVQMNNVQLAEMVRWLAGGLVLIAEIISPEGSKK